MKYSIGFFTEIRILKILRHYRFFCLFNIIYIKYISYIGVTKSTLGIAMKKLIEVDENLLMKLKILSAFEGLSVKALMEKAIELFVIKKEKEQLDSLTDEQKEDIGLLLLMQQADRRDTVSEEKIFKLLE